MTVRSKQAAAEDTPRSRALNRRDWGVLFVLFLLAMVITLPTLGGSLPFDGDNPAHLAEIRDLARLESRGWSDLAYAGFPLHTLQSPVTFGALAFWARAGLPLERCYELICVLGLVAPAAAVYWIARARLDVFWAFALASSVLFYRGWLFSLIGMFGFGIAAAALVLTIDLLARPSRNLRHTALLALLVAFIGLVHMYVTIALVYLALIHFALSLRRAQERSRLRYDVPAFALGGVAAAAYWLPNVLARTKPLPPVPGPTPPLFEAMMKVAVKAFGRLVTIETPAEAPGVLGRIGSDPVFYGEAWLQLLLLAITAVGALALIRSEDAAPRYAAALGALILGLTFLQVGLEVPLLGPQGDRLLHIAKLAFAIAAIPGVRILSQKVPKALGYRVAIASALLANVWILNRLVARQTSESEGADVANLQRTWTWLRENKQPSWGRLFTQDTFAVPAGRALENSHILARTSEVTGVEQIGAFYGHTPYARPEYWDPLSASDSGTVDRVVAIMERANATHVLLVNPALSERFQRDPRFEAKAQNGRYTILERRGAISRWSEVVQGTGTVSAVRVEPGRIQLNLSGPIRQIFVRESFHPFWRMTPPDAGELGMGPAGAMLLELTAKEPPRAVELLYTPPRLPNRLSALGLLLIAGLFAASYFNLSAKTPGSPQLVE